MSYNKDLPLLLLDNSSMMSVLNEGTFKCHNISLEEATKLLEVFDEENTIRCFASHEMDTIIYGYLGASKRNYEYKKIRNMRPGQDALVFIPTEKLPEDAHLSLVNGSFNTVLYANGNGHFVYQMPDALEGKIAVAVLSDLLQDEEKTFGFEVKWIMARSVSELSPMNGSEEAVIRIEIAGMDPASVSLKITGDKKLYTAAESVNALIQWEDLPLNHTREVVLMVKSDSGEYSSTAVTRKIAFDVTQGQQEIQIPLAGNKSGSYRLHITAELGLIAVAEAEYYFIVE